MNFKDLETRFHEAVQHFWNIRRSQQEKQGTSEKTDIGARGAVTGGAQMSALEQLIVDLLMI
jgi:hypothetical protein